MKNHHFLCRLGFAVNGLKSAWQHEKSIRTQVVFAIAALLLMLVIQPALIWWALVVIMIALVINIRDSLKSAESLSPCVLWIDEIEKGIGSDGDDGGTSRRVLGTLLTWMAENKSRVFLVATANDIKSLPPELIRKGRLDEIFFVDLPTIEARREIMALHLEKRELKPDTFALDEIAAASKGFSGAELEQIVVSARYSASADDSPVLTKHLLEEIELTRPLSVVMAEEINQLREWARSRTVSVD